MVCARRHASCKTDMCFPCAKVLHNRRLDRSLYRPVGFESFDSCESEILCEVCGRIVYEDVASDRSWAYARLADSCIGCKDFDAENRDPFAPFRPFFEPILKIANKRHKFTACAICGEIGGAWLGCFMDCETPLCYDHAVQYQEAKEKRGVNIVEEHCERMAEAFDDDMIDEATDEEAILRRMRSSIRETRSRTRARLKSIASSNARDNFTPRIL